MKSGVLLHAKHAYMPNSLGYCGPDDRGGILAHLQESRVSDSLLEKLKEFEAAYPFLKLIASATGKEVFDYQIPEAYWIGNSLLEAVPTSDFYTFSHSTLKNRSKSEVRKVFRTLGAEALPHHTFYVMSTYLSSAVKNGPSIENERSAKLLELVNDCRISWGRVSKIEGDELVVESEPLSLKEGLIELTRPTTRRVRFDKKIGGFGRVAQGDWVSLHWNFACEVLSGVQLENIKKYTLREVSSANTLLTRLRRTL